MGKLDYIKRLIGDLKDEEAEELTADLLASVGTSENNKAEEMNLVLMSDYTDTALERYKNFGKMQGLSTGYSKIDYLTMGLAAGELIIVAGKTSRGKTTLALNIANNVALAGKTVLFVTLEMTHDEITQRSMFINDCNAERGEMTEQYHDVASRTVFQSTDELRWDSIDKLMEKARNELGVDLVVIDHLHYFTRELQNVAEDLGRITKEFKKNAIRHSVPVILISHVKKTGDDKEATIEDLRGSSLIAQDSDIALMVGRSDQMPNTLFVRCEKNRGRGKPSDRPGGTYDDNLAKLFVDQIKVRNYEPEHFNIPDFNEPKEMELDLDE